MTKHVVLFLILLLNLTFSLTIPYLVEINTQKAVLILIYQYFSFLTLFLIGMMAKDDLLKLAKGFEAQLSKKPV